MLAATKQQMLDNWKGMQDMSRGTLVPAALLLLMAMDNGWEIEKAALMPTTDLKSESAYFVTLRTCDGSLRQSLVVPQSSLVQKILEQNALEFAH